MLHTWSLGVEEQFYLIWPVLVVLASRLGSARRASIFATLFLGGLVASELAVRSHPSAAFYLTPFRVFEFACGALLVDLEGRIGSEKRAALRSAMTAAGLAGVGYAVFAFDADTPFPGVAALVPAISTAFIIAAGPSAIARAALANPVFVYLGRASYSIYLAHWPIAVFYRSSVLREFHLAETLLLTAAAVGAGAALHHLVEAPLRRAGDGARMADRAFGRGAVIATLAVAAASSGVWAFAPSRAPASRGLAYVEMTQREANRERLTGFAEDCGVAGDRLCMTPVEDAPNVLVLGDSHGVDGYAMARAAFSDANIMYGGAPGCQVYVSVRRAFEARAAAGDRSAATAKAAECVAHAERVFARRDAFEAADIVILNYRFALADLDLIEDTVAFVRDVSEAQVVILGNAVRLTQPLPDIVGSFELEPGGAIPESFIVPGEGDVERALAGIAERRGAVFLSKSEAFCPNSRCRAVLGDRLVTYDYDHLSHEAAVWFGETVLAANVNLPSPE